MALPFIDLWICEQQSGYILTYDGLRSLNDDEEEMFQPKLLWLVLACATAVSMAISGCAYGALNSLPWCYFSNYLPKWIITTRRRHDSSESIGQAQQFPRRRRRRSSAPAASAVYSPAPNQTKWDSTQETSPQYHHVRHQILLTVTTWIACIALLTAAVLVVLNTTKFFRRRPVVLRRQIDDNNDFQNNNDSDGPIIEIYTGSNNNNNQPSSRADEPQFLFSNVLHELDLSKILAVKFALVISELCFLTYLFWRICHAISIYLLFRQRQLPFFIYLIFAITLACILKTLDVTLLFNSFFAFKRRRSSGHNNNDTFYYTTTCSTSPAQTLVRSIAYAILLLTVALVEHVLHMRTLQSIKRIFIQVNDEQGALQESLDERLVEIEYAQECLRGMRNKLRVIRVCFLVCWAPLALLNLLAAVVYYLYYYSPKTFRLSAITDSEPWWWDLLVDFMVGMSYFCAVIRPFQLLFDAFAYWDSAVPPPPKTLLLSDTNNTVYFNNDNPANYETCTVYSSSIDDDDEPQQTPLVATAKRSKADVDEPPKNNAPNTTQFSALFEQRPVVEPDAISAAQDSSLTPHNNATVLAETTTPQEEAAVAVPELPFASRRQKLREAFAQQLLVQ